MVDQTQMNGRSTEHRAGSAFRRNVTGLVHDFIELAELQFQLFSLDLRDMWGRALLPVVLIVAAMVVALGAIPVLLLSIGWGLMSLGLSEGVALLVTGAGALLIAGLLAFLGWKKLTGALATFSRSQEELKNNIRWVKNALGQQPAPSRRTPPM